MVSIVVCDSSYVSGTNFSHDESKAVSSFSDEFSSIHLFQTVSSVLPRRPPPSSPLSHAAPLPERFQVTQVDATILTQSGRPLRPKTFHCASRHKVTMHKSQSRALMSGVHTKCSLGLRLRMRVELLFCRHVV